MKQWLIILSFLFIIFSMKAQVPETDLQYHHQRLMKIQQNGMVVLGSWAGANIAVNGYMMTQTGGERYYFHQMNMYWNFVNLTIAAGGYLNAAQSSLPKQPVALYNEYNRFSKVLLLNTGLDVAYITTGLYLREKSKNAGKQSERFRGYGNSLMLQGGFLLAFDIVMYFINESASQNFIQSNYLSLKVTPTGFSIICKL